MKSYKWIDSKGNTICATIRDFAERYDFPPSMARSLAAGVRSRLRGWCSGSSKPRVKRARQRFLTKLVNTRTGESAILGLSIAKFARDHGLSRQGLNELITSRVPMYRGWMLESTRQLLDA